MSADTLQPGSEAVKKLASAAMQRHHDHYAKLEAEGILSEEDRPNYLLAMQHETDKLVQPFVVKPDAPLAQPTE